MVFLSVAKSGQNPQFTLEEIKAICETAKDYGFHVAAHAHGDEGMQRAIKGGVKTIEHGTLMSDETMSLMKQYDVYLVPTISAGRFVSEKAKIPNYYPEIVVPKALEIGPKIQDMFKRAYKAGVGIAFGTDAAVFYHGDNAKEFAYMVESRYARYGNDSKCNDYKCHDIKDGKSLRPNKTWIYRGYYCR